MTLDVPVGGPAGSIRVSGRWSLYQVVLHQSVHHSHTSPATSYSPNPLGLDRVRANIAALGGIRCGESFLPPT